MIFWNSLSSAEQVQALARPAMSSDSRVKDAVRSVLAEVTTHGDSAVKALTAKFDGVELDSLILSAAAKTKALASLSQERKDAITLAYENIRAFHQAQQPQDVSLMTRPGVECQLKHVALEAVGMYIPGGTAPLPSTVLMLGTPAQVAGCPRKILCSPPNQAQSLAPEIIFAAELCGVDEIYLCGGAQAIAAMAIGTESIAKVDKIYGPGNQFVTEAKQQVSLIPSGPAIDMPAGPSEVLVLADRAANAEFVAADLLSQAEHGIDSQAILVCDDAKFAQSVIAAVTHQLSQLSRAEIASQAMQHARFIVCEDIATAIHVSNQYAPEHLIVQVSALNEVVPQLKHAGSIFVGPYSPESAGDYASGTNHVLPTYGFSRAYSSLGLLDFYRRYTVQTLSAQGLQNIGPAIMSLADAEGLDAHRNAVKIRLEQLND